MLMAERRAAGKNEGAPPRDLFDLMGDARDPETGEAFTDEQLGDEVATMILAGHETTATALFWSLYLLALDPATQEQVARGAGRSRRRRARSRAAEIHPRRDRRDHAALSAGVPDRARRRRPDTIAGLPVEERT
jgi:unspecific monooxygenase